MYEPIFETSAVSPEDYEKIFWREMGGYNEEIAEQLEAINAIENAYNNGHSPKSLAEIVKGSMS